MHQPAIPTSQVQFKNGNVENIDHAALFLEVQAITKDKWGFYNFLPQSYFFDVSRVLDLYDTTEELNPLT